MTIATRGNHGVTVIDISGHIDIASSPSLRKAMLTCVKNVECLAVNLSAVKYIDSSGIASLLEVLKESRANKKRFVLFGLTDAVREVLELTRLTGVFDICESEQEAVDRGMPAGPRGAAGL